MLQKDRSIRVQDFRPISLMSSIYQVVTKVLSIRLNEVMIDAILDNQGAFVEGRQILDVALLETKVVEDVRRQGNLGLDFKLDFEEVQD